MGWQELADWQEVVDGIGGYSGGKTTAAAGTGRALFYFENNALSLTGRPRLWYNIYNRRRRKLYNMTECRQTGKIAPVRRFYPQAYNYPKSRLERIVAHLHKLW